MKTIKINGNSLTLNDFVNVARNDYKVELTEEAAAKVNKARAVVDKLFFPLLVDRR